MSWSGGGGSSTRDSAKLKSGVIGGLAITTSSVEDDDGKSGLTTVSSEARILERETSLTARALW